MPIQEQYEYLIKLIPLDKRKYIHYHSLGNFIVQLKRNEGTLDLSDVEKTLEEYIEIVEQNKEEIDSAMGLELFQVFINPIGQRLKKYGFVRITPMKYLFLYSIMFDSLVFIAFFPFFWPIGTIVMILYFFLRRRKLYQRRMVYGLFY